MVIIVNIAQKITAPIVPDITGIRQIIAKILALLAVSDALTVQPAIPVKTIGFITLQQDNVIGGAVRILQIAEFVRVLKQTQAMQVYPVNNVATGFIC